MKQIPQKIVDFLHTQSFVIVSSIDKNGFPHSSAKAIVKIDPSGEIYLVDVYHGITNKNIKNNPKVSISVIDEHKFIGYCLKGKARILADDDISQEIKENWENNITSRLTKRLLKNLAADKSYGDHPEARLPKPKHIIAIKVKEIVDLSGHCLKKGA